MQIVIDLPEKTIAHIRSEYGHGKGFYPLNEEDKKIVNDAIYFGTPLPKGHGRIIDESKITTVHYHVEDYTFNSYKTKNTVIDYTDAPTIIEADGGKG